jgi:hypothetical protein
LVAESDVGSVQHHDDMETCGPNLKPPKQRKVSLWLAVKKPSAKKMQGVDILKDLCGVRYYDLDSQELVAIADGFPRGAVEEILGKLSYSSTFLDAATRAAAEKSIKHAYWALAQ